MLHNIYIKLHSRNLSSRDELFPKACQKKKEEVHFQFRFNDRHRGCSSDCKNSRDKHLPFQKASIRGMIRSGTL